MNIWEKMNELAAAPSLLLALDYDGTLVPIYPKPEQALAGPEVRDLLDRCARLPQTQVAIVSGRSLTSLDQVLGWRGGWRLGAHGAERAGPYEGGSWAPGLDQSMAEQLAPFWEKLRALQKRYPGLHWEDKGLGLAVHTRALTAEQAAEVGQEVASWAKAAPGHRLLLGKAVLELRPKGVDKGRALNALRAILPESICVYAGDDTTDEDVFGTVELGVRVGGEEPTAARYRLPDVEALRGWLESLVQARGLFFA